MVSALSHFPLRANSWVMDYGSGWLYIYESKHHETLRLIYLYKNNAIYCKDSTRNDKLKKKTKRMTI